MRLLIEQYKDNEDGKRDDVTVYKIGDTPADLAQAERICDKLEKEAMYLVDGTGGYPSRAWIVDTDVDQQGLPELEREMDKREEEEELA